MENKAQSNARRLLRILTEDKYKRRRAPFIITMAVSACLILVITFYRNNQKSQESYLISREEKLSYKDIDSALKKGVNFESLGKDKKHILYYLANAPYSLEVVSYLKKSGVKLNSLNPQSKNVLEDILLNLIPTHKNLEDNFYENISTLLSLDLIVSDNTIREASKRCGESSLITCLKIAFYYKALGKTDHATSYAKRSCYTSKDDSICAIAKKYILKD